MFYTVKLNDHIRVPPTMLGEDVKKAVFKQLREKYEGHISKDIGSVIEVGDIEDIGTGVIVPGDGAPYYPTTFTLFTFQPEMQEVVLGKIKDMADFGAFINLGPMDGMIHISQTMDDFVSFAKEKVLTGRDTKRMLKVGDLCRARCVAVSFKEVTNPKIALTMRQEGLGKVEWLTEEPKK